MNQANSRNHKALFEDPISLEIIWGRLEAIAVEMQTVLRRIALSALVSAANDLGCEIIDARGWSVAHAATSNPTFNLTLPHVTSKLIEEFPLDTLRPGDVLFTNDPWIGAGHLPDASVVTPFFKEGKVVGFAGSIAHLSDIGGLLNQSSARTVYEEGVLFPPMKLYEAGKLNDAVFATIRGSVRAPEMVIGDINAIVSANAVACRHVVDLLDEYDLDDLRQLSDAVQDRAERAMRNTITKLPDGDYAYEHVFEGPDGPLKIGVVVRIKGDELVVDYVDVPPQHPHGGINSTLTFTVARTTYALNCILTPHVSSNQGLFRSISVHAPLGSILNPTYPASVSERTKVGWQALPLIQGALSEVAGSIPAHSAFQATLRLVGLDVNGVPISTIQMQGGGMGGGGDLDGVDAACFPTSSTTIPVELFESITGAFVVSNELVPESAGRGRARGGHGLRLEMVGPDASEGATLSLALSLNQLEFPPQGMSGGSSGHRAQILLDDVEIPPTGDSQRLGDIAFVRPGERVTSVTAGGGGYGDPLERDPQSVLADVRNGLLTVDSAREFYGVEVDLEALTATRPAATDGRN